MINEEYIISHQTFSKYKRILIDELKNRHIQINNIDELALEGIKFVLAVDRNKSKNALKYIADFANVDADIMFKIFIAKEISQIIYDINDVEDSVKDLFGWITLAIMAGVKL